MTAPKTCTWVLMDDHGDRDLDWEEKCQHLQASAEVKQGHGSYYRCSRCHIPTFNQYYYHCPNPACESDAVWVGQGFEYPWDYGLGGKGYEPTKD